MVVETGSLRSLDIVRLRVARDGYQPNRPAFGTHANAPRHFISVKDGQADVDERNVRFHARRHSYSRLAIARFFHLVPIHFELQAQHVANVSIVLDYKHSQRASRDLRLLYRHGPRRLGQPPCNPRCHTTRGMTPRPAITHLTNSNCLKCLRITSAFCENGR